jgi:pyruvate ferredoxin oxidoreductase gamma subunit/2-oxoisovalerate ferredoxin oxidoreductase gamma subunit
MEEIRFHGRGGQGTVLASISLAKAFFDSGYFVQTFPLFGVERRGAPIEAYLRTDTQKILIRNNVHTPDHIVILDNKLLLSIDVTRGLKKGGKILINAPELPVSVTESMLATFNVAIVNASEIAINHGLGTRTSPIINTSMLGAFSRFFEVPELKSIETAILNEVPVKQEQNVEAAREAFDSVTFFRS